MASFDPTLGGIAKKWDEHNATAVRYVERCMGNVHDKQVEAKQSIDQFDSSEDVYDYLTGAAICRWSHIFTITKDCVLFSFQALIKMMRQMPISWEVIVNNKAVSGDKIVYWDNGAIDPDLILWRRIECSIMLKKGDSFEVVINPRGRVVDEGDSWLTPRDCSKPNVLIRLDPTLGGEVSGWGHPAKQWVRNVTEFVHDEIEFNTDRYDGLCYDSVTDKR